MTRIYQDAELHPGQTHTLDAQAATHIARVLRLRVGTDITLFNGRGGEYSAQLRTVERREVVAEVLSHDPIERETSIPIVLVQAVGKGERMDYAIQKATELGVAAVQPLLTERTVVRMDAERLQKRQKHWQSVAISACEQCGRNRVPQVYSLVSLPEFLTALDRFQTAILLTGQATDGFSELPITASKNAAIALLIGPEGGFTDAEVQQVQAAGVVPARFGSRVLRTETAAVAGLTALLLRTGGF